MAGNIKVPSGMGGLVRYDEEYESKLTMKPAHVIAFIIAIIIFAIGLRIFWPVSS